MCMYVFLFFAALAYSVLSQESLSLSHFTGFVQIYGFVNYDGISRLTFLVIFSVWRAKKRETKGCLTCTLTLHTHCHTQTIAVAFIHPNRHWCCLLFVHVQHWGKTWSRRTDHEHSRLLMPVIQTLTIPNWLSRKDSLRLLIEVKQLTTSPKICHSISLDFHRTSNIRNAKHNSTLSRLHSKFSLSWKWAKQTIICLTRRVWRGARSKW